MLDFTAHGWLMLAGIFVMNPPGWETGFVLQVFCRVASLKRRQLDHVNGQ